MLRTPDSPQLELRGTTNEAVKLEARGRRQDLPKMGTDVVVYDRDVFKRQRNKEMLFTRERAN